MKRIACLALLIALASCTYNREYDRNYTVIVDANLPASVQDNVLTALGAWEAKVGRLHFGVSIGLVPCSRDDHAQLICVHDDSSGNVSPGAYATTLSNEGWMDSNESSSDIYLSPGIIKGGKDGPNPVLVLQTIKHELGHALGLVHQGMGGPDGQYVMCGNPGCAAVDITCADVAQFQDLRSPWGGPCHDIPTPKFVDFGPGVTFD